MQVVERHGGGSHFVRPDRVYRTGVLTSTIGYDPGADVQEVAASFTQFPMDLALPAGGLSGLGATLRQKFAMWKARRRARQFQGPNYLRGHGYSYGEGDYGNSAPGVYDPRYMPGGAYAQVGERYMPAEISKDQIVAQLTSSGLNPGAAQAQWGTSNEYWTNLWWNG